MSSQGKALSPGSGAAPGGSTEDTMKKSTWNRGTLHGSSVWAPAVAITGLHLPVALLFGLFSLREVHALPASHMAPAEGLWLAGAMMLVGHFSAHKARMSQVVWSSQQAMWQSSQGVLVYFCLCFFIVVPNFTDGIA